MKLAATMDKPDLSLNMEQTNLQKNKSLAKYKLTVVFAIAVAIVTAIVIVVLVYFSFVKQSPVQHDFKIIRITAKDGEKDKKVDLEYKVDKRQKMALFSFQDNDGQQILGYRDFQKGVEAFKITDDNMCIVAKLIIDDDEDEDEDDDDEAKHPIFESQLVSVNSSHKFVVLNETIYPTIQQLAIGKRVSSFCGDLKILWMLPEEEVEHSNLPKLNGRKRRTITVGGHAHAVAAPSRFSGTRNRNRCTYSCYRRGRCYRRCY